jgi:hypothetical protein
MIFEPGEYLFLNISPTITDTIVPALYHCAETLSTELFDCCLSHFRTLQATSAFVELP